MDQAERISELVTDAVEKGADPVHLGERDGRVHEPTVLGNVPRDARLLREEQFGPVAAVTPIEDADDALGLANADELALDGCVFTADYDRAMTVADGLDAGGVRINGAPSHGLGDIPFGGNGDSGIGREGLHTAIDDLVREKSIVL